MTVRHLAPHDLAQIESTVHKFPYKPYRHYRVLPRKLQTAVMMAEVGATLAHRDGLGLEITTGAGSALLVGRTLAWDTEFFGVPMARVEYVMAADASLAERVIGKACEAFRARGVRHLSARVDVEDIAVMAALEAQGFRLMDALVTYTTRPRKEPPNAVREVGRIRDFRPADGPELVRIAEDAYRGFRGRFHLDPHLPQARSDALYV
jgi:hypothetical protein